MALPLPNVVADVGPGGPLVTSMRGINALRSDMLANKIKDIEAQYAPVTVPAEAASKLAYAQLMGPQFLAKLMGNQDILANMSPEQRDQALRMVYAAGSGQGTGNNVFSNLVNNPAPQQNNNSLSGWLVNQFKNLFGGNAPQQSNNAFTQQPMSPMQNNNAMTNQPIIQGGGPDAGYAYDRSGNNIVASPAEVEAIANRGTSANPNTFAENVGTYKGRVSEGEEAGKIRANQMKDLAKTVFDGRTKLETLRQGANIIASPEFEQVRQTPILGDKEIAYFKRYGTPKQQDMLGQLTTLNGTVIKDSSRDFAGQFRKGEQALLNQTKINDSDTFNVARGKMTQLLYLAEMLTKRAELTHQYMGQYHIDEVQAGNMADKQINGETIRQQIHNQLNPRSKEAGFNPVSMLDNKYKNAEEFNEALNTLNPESRKQVLDEMKRRGWH